MLKAGKAVAILAAVVGAFALAAPVQAATWTTYVINEPFAFAVDDPCTGASVFVQGQSHQVIVSNNQGSSIYTNVQTGTGSTILNPKGPVLVPTPDYSVTGFYTEAHRFDLGDGSSEVLEAGFFDVRHLGGTGDTFRTYVLFHVLDAPDGQQTGSVDVRRTVCL
jgi:hypothetical protein